MIFSVIRFLCGSVRFEAKNGFAERFVNLCAAEKIELWNMRKIGDTLTATTSIDGYKKIRNASRKSSMNVHIIKKSGLPFLITKNRQRTSLIAAVLLFVIFISLLSNRVWIVNVDGNITVEREVIESAFEESGLKIGRRTSKINVIEVASSALAKINNLSWATVNFNGCVAEIKVRELQEKPSIEKSGGTSNIVAAKDGQVEIIEPYRGTPAVKPGQTVLKGDLLISGVTESRTKSNIFTDANGYIVARTKNIISSYSSKVQNVCRTENSKLYSVYFLGKEFGFHKKNYDMEYKHKSFAVIENKRLPFGFFYTKYSNFFPEKKRVSEQFATLTAMNNYALEIENKLRHTQVISQEINFENDDNGYTIIGEYFCYENIGSRVELDIEETEPEAAPPTPTSQSA